MTPSCARLAIRILRLPLAGEFPANTGVIQQSRFPNEPKPLVGVVGGVQICSSRSVHAGQCCASRLVSHRLPCRSLRLNTILSLATEIERSPGPTLDMDRPLS